MTDKSRTDVEYIEARVIRKAKWQAYDHYEHSEREVCKAQLAEGKAILGTDKRAPAMERATTLSPVRDTPVSTRQFPLEVRPRKPPPQFRHQHTPLPPTILGSHAGVACVCVCVK